METHRHLQMTKTLDYGQQLQSALDDQIYRTNTQTFTAADESNTVEVTMDARRRLTDLYIQDGLLRLGPDTVQQRVNGALRNAVAAVNTANDAECRRLVESLGSITATMMETLGLS
ncbi:YbaB/EbfC family nucleoid-associated protein [Mycobacterium shigaense]|uniref:DNA-binding protein n=1 Tax=Mycobacterium shigaense TaxID=722731 RepID=A0A1Z4EGE3_9MYCO|nr:YbaB/EbfC family nucleoid-associated protein [Mycobacterium shigaense]MEA1123848.1 YbaB/EbfC family nucleoid-associated protein [Mycobacterium shigaense]PRI16698.1 hypothetical protein B2J96_03305 [Mycobacterium shigaense]BAX91996.1 DNA-binding protein [Mycobacterium shigaense]